jgi:hypothetical protein
VSYIQRNGHHGVPFPVLLTVSSFFYFKITGIVYPNAEAILCAK